MGRNNTKSKANFFRNNKPTKFYKDYDLFRSEPEKPEPKDKIPLIELFPTATLVSSWEELKQFSNASETHYLEIEEHNGHIHHKNGDYVQEHYLSTHTFYGFTDGRFGGTYRDSTKILQECGFNVIIKNWDGETV